MNTPTKTLTALSAIRRGATFTINDRSTRYVMDTVEWNEYCDEVRIWAGEIERNGWPTVKIILSNVNEQAFYTYE